MTTDAPSVPNPRTPALRLLRDATAEAVGTFALVFAGCGAMIVAAKTPAMTHPAVAATFGLVIMVMVYAIGHISGAHFNPAVTVAFAMSGCFSWRVVPAYIAAQVVAALVASATLATLFGDVANLGATSPTGAVGASFALEVVLTFFLMFVIMSVATDGRAVSSMSGCAIGGTVALCALFGGPVSGASMNPARSLGPAVVSGALEHVWIYVVAPVVGAVAGALTYRLVR